SKLRSAFVLTFFALERPAAILLRLVLSSRLAFCLVGGSSSESSPASPVAASFKVGFSPSDPNSATFLFLRGFNFASSFDLFVPCLAGPDLFPFFTALLAAWTSAVGFEGSVLPEQGVSCSPLSSL